MAAKTKTTANIASVTVECSTAGTVQVPIHNLFFSHEEERHDERYSTVTITADFACVCGEHHEVSVPA